MTTLTRERTWPGGLWAPPRLDVILATGFVLLSLAEVWINRDVTSPVEHVVVAGLAMALLAWRRRFPVTVAFIVVVSNLVTYRVALDQRGDDPDPGGSTPARS